MVREPFGCQAREATKLECRLPIGEFFGEVLTSRRDNVDRDRLITSTCAVSAIDFRRSAMYGWSSTSLATHAGRKQRQISKPWTLWPGSPGVFPYCRGARTAWHLRRVFCRHAGYLWLVTGGDRWGDFLGNHFEGACLPWAGGLIDRIGGRKAPMLGGLVRLAVGLAFCSTISAIWQFYFWVGIVCAVGIALIGMVPHVAILTREFLQRRATALGIAWAGGRCWDRSPGAGDPVDDRQLELADGLYRLGGDYSIAGDSTGADFLPSGENPAGSKTADAKMQFSEHQPTDWTVKGALTNSAFWLLFTARTLASLGNQIIVTHQIAHAVDVGYAKVFAAAIFGLMGVISIGGRILFGYLADVMGRRWFSPWCRSSRRSAR